MRGEPFVEIESRWEIDQLAEIRFRHFAFEHGRLEVELVLGIAVLAVSASVGHQTANQRRRSVADASDAATGQRDRAGQSQTAAAQAGVRPTSHAGHIRLLLPPRLPTRNK